MCSPLPHRQAGDDVRLLREICEASGLGLSVDDFVSSHMRSMVEESLKSDPAQGKHLVYGALESLYLGWNLKDEDAALERIQSVVDRWNVMGRSVA